MFEAFWSWAEKIAPTVLPKTQLGKAFEYAFKRREFLENYFKDGDCAISNNAAENAIRPFTVGRKNWLFSDTPKGAKASADIYSIVETAKANGALRKNLCKIENCDKNDITRATVKSRSNFLQYTTDTVICQDTSAISQVCRDT